MIRTAVLDTNILVSAIISPGGTPARILDYVMNGGLKACYDSRIVLEYESVLMRPRFKFPHEDVKTLIGFIMKSGISITPEPVVWDMPEEDDRKFYEVAKYCDAILITGNTRHFPAESWIITPAAAISLISPT